MTLLAEVSAQITPPDVSTANETQRLLDAKTKPRGSLGRLEDLVCQIAAMRGTSDLELPRGAIVVMGADHGVAEEGVSAYPQVVTGQMLGNFARGGAAINVLARQAGASLVVVDMGVALPAPADDKIRSHRIGAGTRNFTQGAAMTRAEAVSAVEVGVRIAIELASRDFTLLGIGDMGIGNTTAASALAAVFTGAPPEVLTGRGTGIDDRAYQRKIAVIRQGLFVNRPSPRDGLDALAKVGGFEIAGLAGVIIGAAARKLPVMVDGFICSVAALAATRIVPNTAGYLIASHQSVEPGHRHVLEALGLKPLLDLNLRLGEGTGAALAFGLVEAAVRILREMSTFEAAGVSSECT